MTLEKKSFHISFWLFICIASSILIFIYLVNENKSILPAFIPIITGIIQITIAEKVRGKNHYYPTSIAEYVIINLLLFLLFLFILFSLKDSYLLIKIGTFVIMTFVGIYTSYFMLSRSKPRK